MRQTPSSRVFGRVRASVRRWHQRVENAMARVSENYTMTRILPRARPCPSPKPRHPLPPPRPPRPDMAPARPPPALIPSVFKKRFDTTRWCVRCPTCLLCVCTYACSSSSRQVLVGNGICFSVCASQVHTHCSCPFVYELAIYNYARCCSWETESRCGQAVRRGRPHRSRAESRALRGGGEVGRSLAAV